MGKVSQLDADQDTEFSKHNKFTKLFKLSNLHLRFNRPFVNTRWLLWRLYNMHLNFVHTNSGRSS
jgi:hypothetical protein